MALSDVLVDPRTWLLVASLIVAGLTPRWGLAALLRRRRAHRRRILIDDALKHILHGLTDHRPPSVESVAGALHLRVDRASRLLTDMERGHLVGQSADGLDLTAEGRARALHIVRAHRLWEHHLAEETGFRETEWHRRADRQEHRITPREVDDLAARLGHPTHDPHGDPIPTRSGRLPDHGGRPLPAIEAPARCRIVHIEDEPESVYDRLVQAGLHPGLIVDVHLVAADGISVSAEGDQHVFPPLVAANVFVVPEPGGACEVSEASVRLSSLEPGERGRVVRLSSRCRGPERRRLMDFGIVPGTVVGVEMASPLGDPVAYQVRHALIALRTEQADLIHVVPWTGADA